MIDQLQADPVSSHLFVFCHRGRDQLTLLFWDNHGCWLWYCRLKRPRFWWPAAQAGGPLILSLRELCWLLAGLNPQRISAH